MFSHVRSPPPAACGPAMGRRWTALLPPSFVLKGWRCAPRQDQIAVRALLKRKVERRRKRLCETGGVSGTEGAGHPERAHVAAENDVPVRIAIGERDGVGKRCPVELKHAAGPVGTLRHDTLLLRSRGIHCHP